MKAAPNAARFLELDVLRGLAAVAVAASHYIYQHISVFENAPSSAFAVFIPGFPTKYFGLVPLYLFFMISGFVITWTLERSRTGGDFVFARFSRLFPSYWICVLVTGTAITVIPLPPSWHGPTPTEWVVNLTMLQNFFRVAQIDGVYWSLGVELTFYAWAYVWRRYAADVSMRVLLGVAILLSVGYGVFDPKSNPVPWPIVTILILDHAHFFVAGILGYRIWSGVAVNRTDLVIMGGIVVAILERYPLPVAVAAIFASLLFLLTVTRRMSWIVSPPLVWLGAISYPLYLIHQNIGYIVLERLPFGPELNILATMAFILSLAAAIHYLIEGPAMRRLRAWRKSRTAGAAVS